ncbi:MAG TPA: response regulator [Bacteroidota bacterium]|jgi:DNA-binding response OmpR family regulator
MRVLVAEDDEISRIVLLTKLKKLGHEAIPAEDGEDAWQAFVRERPRLVITDWMMPELDGLELCRRIRSQDREQYTYIIMLTARSGKKHYLEGMEAGADDFLTKPVDMDELTACLKVAGRITDLQSEVRQLQGLLPICGYCKKIRDDHDCWEQIEGYISKRTEATFSHGVCPDCIELHLKPELERLKRNNVAHPPGNRKSR